MFYLAATLDSSRCDEITLYQEKSVSKEIEQTPDYDCLSSISYVKESHKDLLKGLSRLNKIADNITYQFSFFIRDDQRR